MRLISITLVSLFGIATALYARSVLANRKPTEDSEDDNFEYTDMDPIRAKSLTSAWTDDDFRELDAVAENIRSNSADLLLLLTAESGLKPSAVNRRKSDGFPIAVGLNQLTTAANKSAKITEEERLEIPNKPVSYQLPLIENYFKSTGWYQSGKSFNHAGALYEANFAPGRMMSRGTDIKTVLYEQGKDGVFYDQNKGLDTANKGYITVGDLVEYMRRSTKNPIFIAGLTRLRNATSNYSLAPRLPV